MKLNVQKFQTESGNKYIFDNVTGNVFPCSDDMYYIIKNYHIKSKEQIVKYLVEKRLSTSMAENSYINVNNLIKMGCFYRNAGLDNICKINCKDESYDYAASQLILVVTEACNLRCKYCIYSDNYPHVKSYTAKKLNFEVAQKAVDCFIELNNEREKRGLRKTPVVSFYGGEPLLNFKVIKEVVDYCKFKNFMPKYYITTNGTIMNNEIIEFIIENDITMTFSLDGSKEQHDRNRVFQNGNGTFDILYENIQSLQKAKCDRNINQLITFNCTYDAYTDIEKIIGFYIENDNLFAPYNVLYGQVNKYDTLYYDYCEQLHSKGLLEADKDSAKESYNKLLSLLNHKLMNNEVIPFALGSMFMGLFFIRYRVKGKYPPLCNACVPSSKLTVSPEGEFYVCERINQKYSIGNVDSGVDWNKINQLSDSFTDILRNNCRNCNVSRLCDSCYIHFIKEDGSGLEFSKEFCRDKKYYIMYLLKSLYSLLEINPNFLESLNNNLNRTNFEFISTMK